MVEKTIKVNFHGGKEMEIFISRICAICESDSGVSGMNTDIVLVGLNTITVSQTVDEIKKMISNA